MKKNILVVATLCLAATGCVKHQEEFSIGPPQKKITFQTAKYQTSRADEEQINGTKFTYDHFVTHAWSDAAVANKNVFMDHQRIEKNAGGTAWEPTVDYYWPATSTVDFISYYPEQTGPEKTCPKVEREALTYTGYDVSGEKADINVATNDLMYAEKAVGYGGNIDRVNDDNGGDADSGYSGVPTLFHHALAQLEIRVRVKQPAGETESHWEAVIDHAALTGYYTKGDLNLILTYATQNHGVVDWRPSNTTKVGWTLSEDAIRKSQPIVGTGAAHESITISSTGSGEEYAEDGCKSLFKTFVLPQNLTDTHFFDFKFTLKKYRGEALELSEADRDIRHILLKTAAVKYWGMNQKIVYNIVIDPAKAGKLTFDPAVVDWEEVANEHSADDRVIYYIRIPTEEQWETSNVWHAYDEYDRQVAEIAKELLHDSNHDFYQAVVVNPVKDGVVDLKKGFIAQVSERSTGETSDLAGGTVSCITTTDYKLNKPKYSHTITMGDRPNFAYCMFEGDVGKGLEDPSGKRAYTVRPYTVMDNETDRNIYPVVRMGSQYWLRENLRATHYNDGTTALIDKATNAVGDVDEVSNESVRMFEDKATYVFTPLVEENEANRKKYGYLYNFRAVAGAVDGEPLILDDNGNVEWRFFNYQASAQLAQQGVNGVQEGNKQLCPAGWHIPTLNSLYSYWPDVDYLDEAVLYWRWQYAGSADQPFLTNTDRTFYNWSGFSLNLVPAYGQTQEDFTINDRHHAITTEGNRLNGCIPFWNSWLYRLDNGLFYSAIFPLCIDDGQELYLDSGESYMSLDILNITGPKSYPIRCIRNQ